MEINEFMDKLKEDNKFLRTIIRMQYRLKSLAMVARSFNLPDDILDKIFIEDPKFEEIFTVKVKEEFKKIQNIVAWPQINDALKTLSSIASSDDESRAITAASALIRAQQLLASIAVKKAEDEDDIDRLWREIKNEQ